MPAPYSLELRQKIVEVYQSEKLSLIKLATRFKVSLSSVKRYVSLDRESRDLSPKVEGKGRPAKMTETGYETVKQIITEKPTITLEELSKALYKKEKIKAGRSILSRACQKLEMRRKKLSRYAAEQESDVVKKTQSLLERNKIGFCRRFNFPR